MSNLKQPAFWKLLQCVPHAFWRLSLENWGLKVNTYYKINCNPQNAFAKISFTHALITLIIVLAFKLGFNYEYSEIWVLKNNIPSTVFTETERGYPCELLVCTIQLWCSPGPLGLNCVRFQSMGMHSCIHVAVILSPGLATML